METESDPHNALRDSAHSDAPLLASNDAEQHHHGQGNSDEESDGEKEINYLDEEEVRFLFC
jgi:hypothetical protein